MHTDKCFDLWICAYLRRLMEIYAYSWTCIGLDCFHSALKQKPRNWEKANDLGGIDVAVQGLMARSRPQSATKYWNSLGSFWIFETPWIIIVFTCFQRHPNIQLLVTSPIDTPVTPLCLVKSHCWGHGQVPLHSLRLRDTLWQVHRREDAVASVHGRRETLWFAAFEGGGTLESSGKMWKTSWQLHPRNYWQLIWE